MVRLDVLFLRHGRRVRELGGDDDVQDDGDDASDQN